MAVSPATKIRKSPRLSCSEKKKIEMNKPSMSPNRSVSGSGVVAKELFASSKEKNKKKLSLPPKNAKDSDSKDGDGCPSSEGKENSKPTEETNKKKSGKKSENGTPKRNNCPGVRVIGNRIYDSENGKTCHQCRQKTIEVMVTCSSSIATKKCNRHFCPKCLLNRYGEKVEDVLKLDNWNCPFCKEICNCSICMKKQGCTPTGILVHAAKATGFASVADLLKCQGISEEQVNALNVSALKSLLESDRSGNIDIKDIVKKLTLSKRSQEAKEEVKKKVKKEVKEENVEQSIVQEKCLTPSKRKKVEKPSSKLSISSDSLGKKNLNTGNTDADKNQDGLKKSAEIQSANEKTKVKKPRKINVTKTKESTSAVQNVENKAVCESGHIEAVDRKRGRKKKPKLEEQSIENLVACDNQNEFTELAASLRMEKSNANVANNGAVSKSSLKKRKSSTATEGASKQEISTAVKPKDVAENDKPSLVATEDKAKQNVKKMKKIKLDSVVKSENNNSDKDANNLQTPLDNSVLKQAKKKTKANIKTEEIVLPDGEPLQSLLGIELENDEVGPALQLLEFCSAFAELLDIKKGQSESILKELKRGRIGRRGLYSSVVQFHVKLLQLITKNDEEEPEITHAGSGQNSWGQVLKRVIMKKSHSISEEALQACPNFTPSEKQRIKQEFHDVCNLVETTLKVGSEGYDALDFRTKLRLLNLLCDECLCTESLRNWIDSENAKRVASMKEKREELLTAKEKAKEAKQKMKDEIARIVLSKSEVGQSLTINEHDELLAKVKDETEKALAEKEDLLKSSESMKQERCDAVRTDVIVWDLKGRSYWRLKGGSDRSTILLQVLKNLDPLLGEDDWFMYDDEKEKVLIRYVTLSRIASKRKQNEDGLEVCNATLEMEPKTCVKTEAVKIEVAATDS